MFSLPRVMGHRGAAGLAPENTLAAVRTAAESGLDWIEFDIMLTGDDRPVIFHDDKLDRVTGTKGLMAETRLQDLAGLDAGRWFDPAFTGERVPGLADFLSEALGLGLRINAEIKPSEGRGRETAEVAMAELSRLWPAADPPPLISSFWPDCLEIALAKRPDWPRALIVYDLAKRDWRTLLDRFGCVSFHVFHERADAALVAEIKARDLAMACYVVNDPEEARRLYRLGVDCMITDVPPKILPVAKEWETAQAAGARSEGDTACDP